MLHHEVDVVVDIAVQHCHDVRERARRLPLLLVIERMGVRLGDDADTRPACVAEHRHTTVRGGQRHAQQRVAVDCLANGLGVVAQLPDLGSSLVDEAECLAGETNRPRGEKGIAEALFEQRAHCGVLHVQAVTPHEQVQTGRVPAPHLETIEDGQGLLNQQVPVQRRGPGISARQCLHRSCRAQAIVANGPRSILEANERRVRGLDHVSGDHTAGFEASLERERQRVDLVESRNDACRNLRMTDQSLHTRESLECSVHLLNRSGNRSGTICVRINCRIEPAEQPVPGGGRPLRRAAQEGDDPAHDRKVTEAGSGKSFGNDRSETVGLLGGQISLA
ncbi:unannotated protein [freshwater metagenome]|uniref:Unannotated protein n=1 Tax=freshwater metagenome TaxID=449393 RepID=A0A6J7R0P5_9ZZZZ